ncbi:carbohydrate-binding protein [Sphingobacterium rhinopitheci]|uniref:hypothetical protein n=1 Tax=Sphingobacterium rhinopitheci TaxID=2781960 RepID=UPI001F524CAD|nr:hypothetical protein [Sphingobacterium rhinopitheci]MCI0921980.1 hypothetical protein [Sphingobacterium rhinopitheci]
MKTLTNLLLNLSLGIVSYPAYTQSSGHIRLQAENYYNPLTSKQVSASELANKLGVVITGNDNDKHSVHYTFTVPDSGLYTIASFALTDEYGTKLMQAAKTKFESLFMELQLNEGKKTKRVVAVPWNIPQQELGKFKLQKENTLKIWLPKGVILDYIDIAPYRAPAIPKIAANYKPAHTPEGHPRLWVNKNSIAAVRNNLEINENKVRWDSVKKLALSQASLVGTEEISFDENLEKIIEAKAFYYLMTKDEKIGLEAVQLTKSYVSRVSFGNLLDITREIGRTIHITAEVYDWCYDLMNKEDLAFLRNNLMRLAMDMEIGWPPFLQPIVNGHGAEAQIKRDLLSMAIAIYDEDPIPYQYCAYTVLEELVPMRKFEYQSPKHNQGINYGAYRINWDFHAAWLYKRMIGKEIFDPNIKNTGDYWLYFRLPDGQMLRDGDHSLRSTPGTYDYWQINPTSFFMNYSYSDNPYLKHSFEKMNSTSVNPVLFLLLNDPQLKAQPLPDSYPLSKDFGPILGGMVNRTGWEDNIKSNNVVAEIKGGGYYFSNHQHNDPGAIQIYHRGFQVADLGQYKFYGTPYDLNFNKRSVSHSMMLAIDSTEKIGAIPSNDGGTRMFRKIPNSPQELIDNVGHHNGTVLSAATGDRFNYFAVDLKSAYSAKIENYQRNYVFINTNREDVPALIILLDQMETSRPDIKKYWQVNTLNRPQLEGNNRIRLNSSRDSLYANTYIEFLYPNADALTTKILAQEDAHNVFGYQVSPPVLGQIESDGHRVLVSPIKEEVKNQFLSVFQMADANHKPLAVKYHKENSYDYIAIDKFLVLMHQGYDLNKNPLNISIDHKDCQDVYITGLHKGMWQLATKKGKVIETIEVKAGNNTATLQLSKGKYLLTLIN